MIMSVHSIDKFDMYCYVCMHVCMYVCVRLCMVFVCMRCRSIYTRSIECLHTPHYLKLATLKRLCFRFLPNPSVSFIAACKGSAHHQSQPTRDHSI